MTNEETVNFIVEELNQGKKQFVVTANPEILYRAYKNKEYLTYIQHANLVTADGIGVVKGAKILGQYIPERVTGVDIFYKLLEQANLNGYSIYLLGASEEVLEKTTHKIKTLYPRIQLAGKHHGFFNEQHDEKIVWEIQKHKPDFIFVALGSPFQEKWIAQHLHQFEHGTFIGVGGSFDVFSGQIKRAPNVWQKLNLEWFYRLLKQPRRIQRVAKIPFFFLYVMKQKVGLLENFEETKTINNPVNNEKERSL
ncbi:WecB/TagA/CpsF family glycosyltransferase [Anaerobacillus alkalilacustris]|nr:WecB/TagA/CpsF family glycosyltransferase [Anaerobacillus alkalilacustris]